MGKGKFTVKAATSAGDRRNNGRSKQERQEELGIRHDIQKHVCDDACDTPCPLKRG